MSSNNYPGYLITFEGPDGGGKTTVIHRLCEYLKKEGIGVCNFREPGGTGIGDQIRAVLHDLRNEGMRWETELLLYQASRAQIVRERLVPDLEIGKVVILDRFFDSTLAYQGLARGLGGARVWSLIQFATDGLMPDLTVFMDIKAEDGLKRRESSGEWNRLDAESLEFHRTVRKAYLTFLNFDESGRWERVDASRTPDEVYLDVKRIVEGRLFNSCKERMR